MGDRRVHLRRVRGGRDRAGRRHGYRHRHLEAPRLPSGVTYEIGVGVLPEHRGQGVGTMAQRLLVSHR
ncbi:GNAT family N-acetyltransferase [Amycolatopsis sp. WAC 04197]|uniref:GNAT family N-acetyltransferase n=1 Tax=Amycolatopsis sp. WAC 04197 TaxID=2203199 RepID=UPI001F2C0E7C|nr:GNAT family N-acetyltransferase [Amycolatopsis sp. WAC 04197]